MRPLSPIQRRVLEAIPHAGKTYALEIVKTTGLRDTQVSAAIRLLFYRHLIDYQKTKSERGGPPKDDLWLTDAGKQLKINEIIT